MPPFGRDQASRVIELFEELIHEVRELAKAQTSTVRVLEKIERQIPADL